VLFETEGIIEGRIADAPSGAGGFGYDPIFFYPPYGRTLADVSDAEKLRVSHRGAAFRELRAFLERS
jgi:XTP/dITP diphosphohydrolase